MLPNSLFAQIYGTGTNNPVTNGTSNIGIGIDAPVAKLHIVTNLTTLSGLQLDALTSTGTTAPVLTINIYTSGLNGGGGGGPTYANLLTIARDGSTQLNGDLKTYKIESAVGFDKIILDPQNSKLTWNRLVPDDGVNFVINYGGDNANPELDLIYISRDGKVGINTSNFVGDYSFYVDGGIIAEKAVVKLEGNWPDYVFLPDYEMMGFEELLNYINQYGRLPKMPTAAEVKENGLDLGGTQALLLEKIEEMTLMMLQLHARIAELEAEIEELRK
jgi:hypothetical protein